MNIKKSKSWSDRLLSLFLAAAFLTMQWTPAHIHLGEQHDHQGLHQHQAELHAHSLIPQTIATDSPHDASHASVIMLVKDCSISKQEKQKEPTPALVARIFSIPQPFLLVRAKIPVATSNKLNYLDLSTVNPRAPPQIS